jgi:hypothetical protein
MPFVGLISSRTPGQWGHRITIQRHGVRDNPEQRMPIRMRSQIAGSQPARSGGTTVTTFSQDAIFGSRLSRRTAMKGAFAAGVAGALGLRGLDVLARQDDAAYPEVTIVSTEYAFEMPATVESGLTRVILDNTGAAMDHHAILLRVNDDATLADLEAALTEPSFEPIFAVAAAVGGPSAGPGVSESVIVDLTPGSYIAICAIPDDQGVPHYALGMQATFEVTDSGAAAEAPEVVATVQLMEMMFHGLEETTVATGPQVWAVENVGAQIHELVLLRLAPGVTFDDLMAMMMAPPEASPMPEMDHASPAAEMAGPPVTSAGGVAPMGPGFTNYVELDLQAGEHVAICFVPDPETGAPHAALGMVMPFTVS